MVCDDLSQLQFKCASSILDVLPWLRHYLRAVIRDQPQATITLQEVRVLARLKRFPNLSLSLLADELGINKTTASLIVDRMVKQELVTREKNSERKRELILNATASGLHQLEKTLQSLQDNLASQMETLSFQDLQDLDAGLNAIKKMLRPLYPNLQSVHSLTGA